MAVKGVAEYVAHCLLEAVEVGADFVGEGEAAEDDASELGAWGGGGPCGPPPGSSRSVF